MLKSNLLCAFIALITAITISSAFAKGYLKTSEFEIATVLGTQDLERHINKPFVQINI